MSESRPSDTSVFSVRLPVDALERLEAAVDALGIKSRNQIIQRLIYRLIGYLDPDPAVVDLWQKHLRQVQGGYTNLNQLAKSAKRGTVIWTDDDRRDVENLHRAIIQHRQDLKAMITAARRNREPEAAIRRILRDDDWTPEK
ncbi:ribbon-helix-helix protein, CopG family [uncultured Ruegeria sp.]|uniref:ribbon-helix-helix protein, CopG family n=1 Tax=uncultured Ruegeria sp. TaxID=259304 RepID=UPI0026034CA5|nr:ribbon-helix-helix protein, CopG family [uncultured Ruegeria sp.]